MENLFYYDYLGIFGVFIVLVTYFLLQLEKVQSTSLSYSLLNVFGSLLILYSLMFNWNISSFIIEFFWILISLFGVWKYIKINNTK
ncbi:CBU_0592 family membrane protein [Candidatus Sulfurimonas baltica]|uniref:CBU_0592 family membrane protein n=1 Tax=Candidatus Sulfurimonas baltica TaxID=2740404 RepID=UPI003D31C54C